jgi:hypothetical protein
LALDDQLNAIRSVYGQQLLPAADDGTTSITVLIAADSLRKRVTARLSARPHSSARNTVATVRAGIDSLVLEALRDSAGAQSLAGADGIPGALRLAEALAVQCGAEAAYWNSVIRSTGLGAGVPDGAQPAWRRYLIAQAGSDAAYRLFHDINQRRNNSRGNEAMRALELHRHTLQVNRTLSVISIAVSVVGLALAVLFARGGSLIPFRARRS